MRPPARVAVTGAARGIGQAIARALAADGYPLLLGDLDASVHELATELGAISGLLDVTDEASYRAWLALVPQVDVLVNNAGIIGAYEPLAAIDLDVWQRTIDVNLSGVFYGMRAVIPRRVSAS